MTKSKLNILFISPIIPIPPDDGGKISLFGLLKGLSSNGHKVDFFCYLQNKDYDNSIDELSVYCKPFIIPHSTENKISKAILNFFNPLPYNLTKYISQNIKKELKNYFDVNTPDLIHVATLSMAWVLDEVRKYSNAPIILRQENFESMIFKRRFETEKNIFFKYYLKYQYNKYIKYEPAICGKFDKCIMISDIDAKRLLDANNRINTVAIPVGVDEIENKFHCQVEPFSMVHLGSLKWYPNYDALLWFVNDILPKIVKNENRTKLYIYGSDIPKNFTIPESVKNNIVVRGFVENLWEELSSKSVAVVPLRIGGGIRVKILEMMSFGIPLVTTSIGKEGIDVKDREHILVANSPDEFNISIQEIWQNKTLCEKLVTNSKIKISENYTWDSISEKLEVIYKELVK